MSSKERGKNCDQSCIDPVVLKVTPLRELTRKQKSVVVLQTLFYLYSLKYSVVTKRSAFCCICCTKFATFASVFLQATRLIVTGVTVVWGEVMVLRSCLHCRWRCGDRKVYNESCCSLRTTSPAEDEDIRYFYKELDATGQMMTAHKL